MATQPDFGRLASGFTAVAEEIRKLPEVPVINEGRAILESINGIRQHSVKLNTRQLQIYRLF